MYSSILDVLLSPIAFLSKEPFIFIGLLVLPFLIYYFFDQRDRKKNPDKVIPKGHMNNEALMTTFFVFALGLSGFFFGTGIGSGISESRKIKKGDFKLKHQITFMDNKKSNVRLIGSNSQFVFYVLENNKHVTISPIQGNVKAIDVNDE